jgi:RecA-family ATPase
MVSAASRKDLESVGTLLSEVKPESVEWLWPGRLPKGKLSLIEGDPGTGKSTLTIDLAARVSVGGELPDGMGCEAAGVVLVSAEDGPADTIRPRPEPTLRRCWLWDSYPTRRGTSGCSPCPPTCRSSSAA